MRLDIKLDGLDPTDKGIKIAKALADRSDLTMYELRIIGAFLLAYTHKHEFDKE